MTALGSEFDRLAQQLGFAHGAMERLRDTLIPFLYVTGDIKWNPVQQAAVDRVREALDHVECLLDPELGAPETPKGPRKGGG